MANVYNTIYRGNFCSPDGTDNVIEFKQRMLDTDVVPTPSDIIFAGHDDAPVSIEYNDKGDYKQEPINGCSCTIGIIAQGTFELKSLYTADEREWMVVVDGSKKFTGFLIPDSCSEPYESKPYKVTVQATDALGTLEDLPFQKDNGVKYKGFYSDIELLRVCLEKTGLQLPMLLGVNTYEVTMNRSFPPMQQTFIDTARFLDSDGNAFSCLEVIRSILERWSARLHQFNGYWQIVNVLEKSRGNVKAWKFSAAGTADGFVMLGNVVYAGGSNRDIKPTSANNETAKGFKSSTAYYQYGYPGNELANGDFDDWTAPAQFPVGWQAYDGANGRTETRVDQTTGLATSDHYIVITSNGSGGGYIGNTGFVQVRANQKVVIDFDLEATSAFTSTIGTYRYLGIRLADNLGKFYNAENGWVSEGGFYVIQYRGTDLAKALKVSIELVQQPTDYQLYFGVQGISSIIGTVFETKINNVSIKPQTVSSQTKPALGVFNRETLKSPQTYKKDPVLLLHGDELNEQRTSRISIGSDTVITPPTFWERASVNDPVSGLPERQSLLHIVANSELRNHQRPYQIFSGQFVGFEEVDVNTILKIDLLSPIGWIFLSGTFDIKTGIHELRFAEVLIDEPNYIEEFSVEDYGTEKGKEGFSVGQPDSVSTSPGSSYIDTSGFAQISDIPVKASATETQAGTNDDKFITPFKLLGWWTNIKTLAATISGLWNFTTRPTYNGANLITLADVPTPTETDTLQSVTNRGAVTTNPIQINSADNTIPNLGARNSKLYLSNGGSYGLQVGVLDSGDSFSQQARTDGIATAYNQIHQPKGGSFIIGDGANDGRKFQVKGQASVTNAPTSATDIVRLTDLQSFKGSDTILTKNTDYTVLMSDFGSNGNVTIYVDTTSGNKAITLPTPANMNGYTANIIKESSDINSVIVTATINGITNDVLSNQFDAGTYKSKGTAIFKF